MGRKAAEASSCVYLQVPSAFWLVHDNFYRDQSSISADKVNSKIKIWLATTPSFDTKKFDNCVENGSGSDSVRIDEAIGRQLGVQATPTLFINGSMLKGMHTADQIHEEIRKRFTNAASEKDSIDSPNAGIRHQNMFLEGEPIDPRNAAK